MVVLSLFAAPSCERVDPLNPCVVRENSKSGNPKPGQALDLYCKGFRELARSAAKLAISGESVPEQPRLSGRYAIWVTGAVQPGLDCAGSDGGLYMNLFADGTATCLNDIDTIVYARSSVAWSQDFHEYDIHKRRTGTVYAVRYYALSAWLVDVNKLQVTGYSEFPPPKPPSRIYGRKMLAWQTRQTYSALVWWVDGLYDKQYGTSRFSHGK
jgi:hypothetical protein